MPISFRRRATMYDITPYRPIVAMSPASAPKNPDSVAIRRSRSSESRTWLSIVWYCTMMFGPIARVTSAVNVASGALDRSTT